MQGKLIVIEGLDGSGKATQTKLLYDRLKAENLNVMQVSFPDYESDSSALVRMYLNGGFGNEPGLVNPYAASSFYAVDRYASFMRKWKGFYLGGGIVIADRYTTSNAIHQCSKLPKKQWAAFLTWLFNYEYDLLGIPKPDMVLYLKVGTRISQQLLSKRYHGDDEKKDIHEANRDYLDYSRIAADYCAEALGWQVVECTKGNAMRSIEDISDDIFKIVSNNNVI